MYFKVVGLTLARNLTSLKNLIRREAVICQKVLIFWIKASQGTGHDVYGVGRAPRSTAALSIIVFFLNINLMEKAKRKETPSSKNGNQSSVPADNRQKDKIGSSEGFEVFEALDMAEDIVANIQQIPTKLQKVDSLEALINKTLNKLEAVELQVNRLTIRVESVECKSKALDEAVGKLRASVDFTSNAYDTLVSTQTRDKENSTKEIAQLKKQVAYLEACSRREN